MKPCDIARWGTLLCLVGAFAASPVRAEPGWTYFWTTTTPLVGNNGVGVSVLPASGSGSGSSDIGAANLEAISSASAAAPDSVDGVWDLTLHLTDTDSNDSGALLFTGRFNGTVAADGVNVDNSFDLPTSQSLPLGGHTYNLTIGLYSPPGLPGSSNLGAIGASLDVIPGGPPVPPETPVPPPPMHNVPEPSSLALAALSLTFLGLKGWRRQRTILALA